MNLLWLFPAGLAALAALLLPLLVHLARRDQQQLVDFAALRWLAARPRPRHRLRFDEWPLLLVRLLLLALLALLLARPALEGVRDDAPRIAVLPGVALDDARAASADAANAHWLWLAPGFPRIGTGAAPAAPQPVASLLRELDSILPAEAPLTVVVPAVIDGLDAQRPQLARHVQWQVVESPPPMAAARAARPAPPPVQIRHDDAGRAAVRYLRAAAAAWQAAPVAVAADSVAFTTSDTPALRVWLSAQPLPADTLRWAAAGGQLLVDARTPLPPGAQRTAQWQDDNGTAVLEQVRSPHGRWWRWTAALDPAGTPALLDADFPQRLRAVLQPPPAPQRARAAHMQPGAGAMAYPPAARELAPWLIAAIALLFLLERGLASAAARRRPA